MKISDKILIKSINKIMVFYPNFAEHTRKVGTDVVLTEWECAMDRFDFKYTEEEFLKAIDLWICTQKEEPTIYDISWYIGIVKMIKS